MTEQTGTESLGRHLGFSRNFFFVFIGLFIFVLTKCSSLRPLPASTQCCSYLKSFSFHLESSSPDAGGTLSGLGGRVGAGGQNLEEAVAEVRNVRCDEREVKP